VYLEAAVDLAAFSAGRAHAAGLAGPRLSHDALPPTLGTPLWIAGRPCGPGGSVWLAPGPLETALAARAIIPVASHLPGGVCPRAGRRRPRARNRIGGNQRQTAEGANQSHLRAHSDSRASGPRRSPVRALSEPGETGSPPAQKQCARAVLGPHRPVLSLFDWFVLFYYLSLSIC